MSAPRGSTPGARGPAAAGSGGCELLRAPPRGRVLALAPHADDEVLGCGGTLRLHALQGDPVQVVVGFDGLLGLAARWPRDTRRREADRAAAALGLPAYRFLDHPEGHVPAPAELEAGARELALLIEELAPDVVYGPWPGEQHVDHASLARALVRALELARAPAQAWGYEVWTPLPAERVVDVTPAWERKLAALAEYASQDGGGELAARAEQRGRARAPEADAASRGEAFARVPRPGR